MSDESKNARPEDADFGPQYRPWGVSTGMVRALPLLLLLGVVGVWWRTRSATGSGRFFGAYSGVALVANGCSTFVAGAIAWIVCGPGGASVRRRRLFSTIAVAIALSFALGSLETLALLGVVDYRIVFNTPFAKAWENPRNRLDRELLHIHRPHDCFTGSVPGDLAKWYGVKSDRMYEVDVRYDANGFRNDGDCESADIVVLGDSFVEGVLVRAEQTLTSRLASLLEKRVLNLGQTGYGPQQESVVLRRFALPAKPETVVWVVFGGNDLTHDYRRYEQSTSDWDRYVGRSHGFSHRSFTRNALRFLEKLTTSPQRTNNLADRRFGRLDAPGEGHDQRMYFGIETHELSDDDLRTLRGSVEIMVSAFEACLRRKTGFLLVYVPVKYDVYGELCEVPESSDLATWRSNRSAALLGEAAESKGIPFLDLTLSLRDAARQGTLVFFLDDGHWNAEGHRIAAERIAEVLRSQG